MTEVDCEGGSQAHRPHACGGRAKRNASRAVDVGLVILALAAVTVYRLPILMPGLYCVAPVQDIGAVRVGDRVNVRYRLWNLHPWAVTVVNAYPACGCIAVVPQDDIPTRVRAFGFTDVEARIRASAPAHLVDEAVFISTNDRADPLVLRVTGRVLPVDPAPRKESSP